MIDDDPELQQMIDEFQPGLYLHYKGRQYLALCLAREDETDEVVVVYTRLYPRAGLPVSTRRLTIWNEEILVDGERLPRFRYCGQISEPEDEDTRDDSLRRRSLIGWVKENL